MADLRSSPWTPLVALSGEASPSLHTPVSLTTDALNHGRPKRFRRRRRFIPLAHRSFALLALAAVFLALIGVLEYSLRVLPQLSSAADGSGSNSLRLRERRSGAHLDARLGPVEDSHFVTREEVAEFLRTSARINSSRSANAFVGRAASAADSTSMLESQTSIPRANNSEAGATSTAQQTLYKAASSALYVVAFGSTFTTTFATPPPSDFRPPTASTTDIQVAMSTETTDIEQTATSISAIQAASTAVTDGQPQSAYVSPIGKTSVSALTSTTSTSANGQGVLAGSQGFPSQSVAHASTSPVQTTPVHKQMPASAGHSAGGSDGVALDTTIAPSILKKASSTGDPLPTSTPLPQDNDTTILQSSVPLALIEHLDNYILGAYLPIITAVIIRLCAGYLYRCTKLIDPFVMLSRPEGAMLKDFFWADHIGGDLIFAPIYAFWSRRWALLSSSLLYAAAQLLPPFASELTTTYLSSYSVVTSTTAVVVFGQALWINQAMVRVIQTLLAFIFIQILCIWFLIRGYNLELSENPARIATIAALIGHPETVEDFSAAAFYTKKSAILAKYANNRYRLESFVSSDNITCYGIVPVHSQFDYSHYGAKRLPEIPYPPQTDQKFRSTPQKDLVNLSLITATTLSLLGIVVAYELNTAPTNFEYFMDSQGFGPRFILSLLGLVLKSPLLRLCSRTTASIPFKRLALRPRRAKLDIRRPIPLTPQGSIVFALRRREWFDASLAAASGILIEIVLILLPGIPYNGMEYWEAARTSWFGSMACLGLILVLAIVGWIRLALKIGYIAYPFSPNSPGAIAMYVAGSTMAAEISVTGSIPSDGALYDFKRRSGRWLLDYTDGIQEGIAMDTELSPGIEARIRLIQPPEPPETVLLEQKRPNVGRGCRSVPIKTPKAFPDGTYDSVYRSSFE